MKRLFGTFVLLAGLSGCVSFTAQPGAKEKKAEAKPTVPPPMVPGMVVGNGPAPTAPAPAMASWSAHPDHQAPVDPRWGTMQTNAPPVTRPPVDYTAARMAYANAGANKAAPTPQLPARTNVGPTATTPTNPVPTASTPPPAPTPAVAMGNTQPPAPLPLPASPPTVITPRGEQAPDIQQVSNTSPVGASDNVIQASRTEAVKPRPATNPMPMVKNSKPVDTKPVKPGAPLMRLVNTKRITLNFEVKDVGPSGLGGVELWYTQDCKEWKKYDAPTQAQAYVIEVDEEGMYGFTLLAKSGIGLGQQPPASGDQPQVWVVVDLTKPDVQLTDLTPTTVGRTQQVNIGWKASDSNLGRQPITLMYAEKEEGPWKPIATNLENSGKYVWQAPTDVARVLVKVEATDLSGNVGKSQSAQPVMLDNARPRVAIINVEAAPGNK